MSRGLNAIRLSIDDYYLPRELAPRDEHGNFDLESIYALDIELFNKNMLDLINGEEVELPRFDFKLGKRVNGRKLKVAANQPIIIEGIHALNEQLTSYIPKHQNIKSTLHHKPKSILTTTTPLALLTYGYSVVLSAIKNIVMQVRKKQWQCGQVFALENLNGFTTHKKKPTMSSTHFFPTS
jgi:hypothetical protein